MTTQSRIEFAAPPPEDNRAPITIKVIGVGGGGGNAINTMVESGLKPIEVIAANTDQQALSTSRADHVLAIGQTLTKGHGAGARPDVGRRAAEESRAELMGLLEGADVVFITAGMGGGTGTGAAPVVAEIAKQMGALTVAVVTRPFKFEGRKRSTTADTGIEALKDVVDTLFVIPNERLFSIAGDEMSGLDAFKLADHVLLDGVRGLVDLIHSTGVINADFADVRTVMGFPGLALMGVGTARGELRAVEAAQRAVSSPLLEEIAITGAKGVLVNITSSPTLKMREMNEAVTLIYEEADGDAEVVFGWVVDETMGDEVRVTVIATGFEQVKADPVLPSDQAVTRPSIDRVLKVEPRGGGRRAPITAVTPWDSVGGPEAYDLPPSLRQSREERGELPTPSQLLDRDPGEVLRPHEDDEMSHLDKPTYVRRLAD
ncbi:MAG: cell division protein FtsZ [Deltaproteobacteria bacterium]|nr:cell division protein FtsZ [Deltaproteobacteria bacterium]